MQRRDFFRTASLSAAFGLGFLGKTSAAAEAAAADVRQFAPPALDNPENWTMVVIPDPQQYTTTRNYPLYEIMMNWIAENQTKLNIRTALCVGDIVNSNASTAQWEFASRAFSILDDKIPYVLCTGNHDYGKGDASTRETRLNDFFPAARNSCWENTLVEQEKNTFGAKTLELAAYEIATTGEQKLLVISLPFAPTDDMLAWAKGLCDSEKYANHFISMVTHQYLLPHARNNVRDASKGYKILKEDGNNGEEMWQKLVQPAKNLRLVVSGHHSCPDKMSDCTGFRTDKNVAGKTAYQMVFDTQALGGGWGGNGGDGWLRMLEFSKDMKRVKAYTFSPFFAISPSTQFLAYDREEYNQFEFQID
ncbi:MAG: metallophosphoesterase [Planctomycetia bacterium]|nr:metallophosphoesterase [Planctomycetia bacterium]